MPAETSIAVWLLKLAWIPIIGPIVVWLIKRVTTDIYTKKETDQMIALSVDPMKELLDRNAKSLDKLTDCMAGLNNSVMELRVVQKERNDRIERELNKDK